MEPITLTEGMPAPDFTLLGSDHRQHRLRDYLGKKLFFIFILVIIRPVAQMKQRISVMPFNPLINKMP